MFLLAHNNGSSEIWHFSYPTIKLLKKIQIGNQGHNIWKKNDVFFTCNSQAGLIQNIYGFNVETGGFCRGAVITDNVFIIGVSGIAEKSKRHSVLSVIYFYDNEWYKLNEIMLEGEGQILDIRSPGIKDICSPGCIGKYPQIPWNNIIYFPTVNQKIP